MRLPHAVVRHFAELPMPSVEPLPQACPHMSPPLQQLYPELGVELPERQYGGDCALYIPGKGINWQVGAAALLPTYAPGSAAS